LKISLEK